MNRRDFLSFKAVREPEPTFDLACHAFYMRWVEATRGRESASGNLPAADPGSFPAAYDPLQGEPAAQVDVATVDELLRQLEGQLAGVRRLRVLDGEWLQTTGLGERVAPLLDAFRARGGIVVFDSSAAY